LPSPPEVFGPFSSGLKRTTAEESTKQLMLAGNKGVREENSVKSTYDKLGFVDK
jgi:hypothetical protein